MKGYIKFQPCLPWELPSGLDNEEIVFLEVQTIGGVNRAHSQLTEKIVKASDQVKIFRIFTCWHMEAVRPLNFLSIKVRSSCSITWRFMESISAKSAKWSSIILVSSFTGTRFSVSHLLVWVDFFSRITHCQECKKQKYLIYGWF